MICGNYYHMKKKKTKSIILYTIISILAIITIFSIVKSKDSSKNRKEILLEVVSVKGGYGYQIKEGNRILIDQPFIPAISEEKAFKSREDAQKVGELVLKRVKNHTDFSVSVKELRELNIE